MNPEQFSQEQPSPEEAPEQKARAVVEGEVDFDTLAPEDQEQLNAALHEIDEGDEGFESLDDVLKKLS